MHIIYKIKRKIFIGQLQRICKKNGYRLSFHRSLLEYRDGDDNERDFSIFTDDSVFSVKMIPVRNRVSILRLVYNGTYSIAEGTYLPQTYYMDHKKVAYQPKIFRKMPQADLPVPESDGKTIRNIFLVHPTCYEYECVFPRGSSIAASGDTFLGWELWCGRDFRKMLKSGKN